MTDEKAPKRVSVVLIGASYNAKDGDRVQVDEKRAAQLVASGAARYTKSASKS